MVENVVDVRGLEPLASSLANEDGNLTRRGAATTYAFRSKSRLGNVGNQKKLGVHLWTHLDAETCRVRIWHAGKPMRNLRLRSVVTRGTYLKANCKVYSDEAARQCRDRAQS